MPWPRLTATPLRCTTTVSRLPARSSPCKRKFVPCGDYRVPPGNIHRGNPKPAQQDRDDDGSRRLRDEAGAGAAHGPWRSASGTRVRATRSPARMHMLFLSQSLSLTHTNTRDGSGALRAPWTHGRCLATEGKHAHPHQLPHAHPCPQCALCSAHPHDCAPLHTRARAVLQLKHRRPSTAPKLKPWWRRSLP
jgi:hypothetical protein